MGIIVWIVFGGLAGWVGVLTATASGTGTDTWSKTLSSNIRIPLLYKVKSSQQLYCREL